jgi:hypothetical protein
MTHVVSSTRADRSIMRVILRQDDVRDQIAFAA